MKYLATIENILEYPDDIDSFEFNFGPVICYRVNEDGSRDIWESFGDKNFLASYYQYQNQIASNQRKAEIAKKLFHSKVCQQILNFAKNEMMKRKMRTYASLSEAPASLPVIDITIRNRNIKKVWIATYVDYGETADGKARVLAIYKTKEEALAAMYADIEGWRLSHQDEGVEVDFDKMAAWFDYNDGDRCEWNIEEYELDAELIKKIAKEV